jgi:hypothetical protein
MSAGARNYSCRLALSLTSDIEATNSLTINLLIPNVLVEEADVF